MSWQLGSFLLLALVLGSGMLWYEFSRPPSQIVALVAVLAALAVAGRIVLAPIPNVIATTDIVIFAGYVLGPAPGFTVGALGGLISNFWLGQGAWTPWQMVGWGMAGIGGAVMWKVTGGRANRLTLALVCGLAGLVFGAWMNLQTMVSYGGEMSLDRYLALEVRAIPFDLAHMIGNILFALVAGPAMIAAMRRFRERFEWRRVTGTAGAFLVAVALLTTAFALASPATERAEAGYPKEVRSGAAWLKARQTGDGGFPSSPGGDSALTFTARSMFALAAAGINPLDVKSGGKNPYNYLVSAKKSIKRPNDLALVILALKTIDRNPRKFEGRNLLKALHNHQGNGSFGDDVNVAAYAALAFRSAGVKGAALKSIKWLRSAQNKDGGWGIGRKARSDPDSTGTALMAVGGKKTIRRAVAWLRKAQRSSGGFVSGSTVNSQSTGLVIQGLVAAGTGPRFLKSNRNTAADFLLARQQKDGSIWYSKDSDQTRVWVTADALTALAAKPLPIPAPPRAKKPKPDRPDRPDRPGGDGDGGGGNGGGGSGGYSPGPGSQAGSPGPSGSSGRPGRGDGGAGSGGGKGGSASGDPTPPDPTTPAPEVGVPVTPVIPSDALLVASAAGPAPSPLIAILIGLAVSGGLCGGTILLVRKYRW